mmetsp:Transcript_50860/g.115693  ORF Transcript_50860/g.115693 Transcript_50860/m.115693 type:complete len:245 (+) Transcript_50860:1243-1977(+)
MVAWLPRQASRRDAFGHCPSPAEARQAQILHPPAAAACRRYGVQSEDRACFCLSQAAAPAGSQGCADSTGMARWCGPCRATGGLGNSPNHPDVCEESVSPVLFHGQATCGTEDPLRLEGMVPAQGTEAEARCCHGVPALVPRACNPKTPGQAAGQRTPRPAGVPTTQGSGPRQQGAGRSQPDCGQVPGPAATQGFPARARPGDPPSAGAGASQAGADVPEAAAPGAAAAGAASGGAGPPVGGEP